MGIFGFKNKNDIVPKEKHLKGFVTKFDNVKNVKINAKLVVPNGYTFVIGKKGKALDKFDCGEHYLTFATLPIMCRKFHIDDPKKTKEKKEFPADFYFIETGIQQGEFETYRKVDMGTKAYGLFSTKVYGTYTYKVSDAKEFLQSLLNEYDYIKTGEAEELLSTWVNEAVVKELENQNFMINDVLANSPIIAESLKLKLSKLFSVAGLELLEIKITKYKLPKKYSKLLQEAKIDEIENENQQKEVPESQETNLPDNLEQESNATNVKIQQTPSQTIKEQDAPNLQNQESIGYGIDEDVAEAHKLLQEFGIEENVVANNTEDGYVMQSDSQNLNCEEVDINNQKTDIGLEIADAEINEGVKTSDSCETKNKYVPFGNFSFDENLNTQDVLSAKKKAKEKTFVDLSLNELYTNKTNTKRCLGCGTENHIDANHCILCGENFNKGDEYDN